MDERELRDALAEHTIPYKGATYRAALVRRETDPLQPDSVDLHFMAARVDGAAEPVTFKLHLSGNTFDDRARVLRVIDGTVNAILDGKMPLGAHELL